MLHFGSEKCSHLEMSVIGGPSSDECLENKPGGAK